MSLEIKDCVLTSTTLSKLMKEQKDLFYGKSYAASTISSLASNRCIPARQMDLKGRAQVVRVIEGRYSFDVSEIIRWCQLGADRAACIQVLREREA